MTNYDPTWNEQTELMGEMYDEVMDLLRQEFGADLLSDSDLDEDQIMRDFYVERKD